MISKKRSSVASQNSTVKEMISRPTDTSARESSPTIPVLKRKVTISESMKKLNVATSMRSLQPLVMDVSGKEKSDVGYHDGISHHKSTAQIT